MKKIVINQKIKAKLQMIFVIVSVVFLVAMVTIYGYRFIHYYKLSHVTNTSTFNDILISKVSYDGDGLYKDEDTYYYKGLDVNNYLYYSGHLWRIVSTKNGVMKLITTIPETSLSSTDINTWLTNDFIEVIDPTFLSSSDYCYGEATKDYTCGTSEESSYGLLSVSEYQQAGSSESYLNTGYFQFLSETTNSKQLYITGDGVVSIIDTDVMIGLSPVITINADLSLLGGDGTKDNPYLIKEYSASTLEATMVGSYITYGDYTYRLMAKNDTSVTLIMDGLLAKRSYSSYDNNFNVNTKNSLAYYLNNTFYSSVKGDSLVTTTLKTGIYKTSYTSISDETTSAMVGLATIGDKFIDDYDYYYLITRTGKATQAVYGVRTDGLLYSEAIDTSLAVRPIISLNKEALVVSGTGTKLDPYIVDR